ncbi:MAG TPA: PilZ domain-containing protein [Anaeromyxobacteraceae bacterium]|nr:PilZ domain-containing protein [Anaeromyxobacteraceae bacterium]
MNDQNRRYERIEIELPCRMFIPRGGAGEKGAHDALQFEAFCVSRNLGLGGVFVASSFLLKIGVELYLELGLPDGPLAIRSQVAHIVGLDDPHDQTGMGIEFLDVDKHGRETLLRYFTPLRYQSFFERFMGEFPHLRKDMPLPDVSLVLNLWEEWKIQNEGGPLSTQSGAPPAVPHKVRPPALPEPTPARPPIRPRR